jgi:excisionase family DNA binding protein
MEEKAVAEWLRVKRAAELADCSPSFLLKHIHKGTLKASNIGLGAERAEWRIRRSDLESFMSAGVKA